VRRFEVSEGSRKVGVGGLKGILLLSKTPGILEGPCDMLRQPKSSTDKNKKKMKSHLVFHCFIWLQSVLEESWLKAVPHRWKNGQEFVSHCLTLLCKKKKSVRCKNPV